MRIILGLFVGPTAPTPPAAPRWVMTALQSIEVTQGDGGKKGDWTQGFQVHLRAERGRTSREDYQVLVEKLLQPGRRLIVTVSLGATRYVLMDGVITGRTLNPQDDNLYLQGKDLSQLMDLSTPDVVHAGTGHKEIASFILRNYQKYGIKPQVSDPPTSWPGPKELEALQTSTDRQYLKNLAQKNGFVFLVKPGSEVGAPEAWWGPEKTAYAPARCLTVNAGPATNVVHLTFTENGLAAIRTFGAVEAGKPGELMKIDIQKSGDKTNFARTSGLDAYPELQRLVRLCFSSPYAKEVEAQAQARTDRSAEDVLGAHGSLDTFRYGDVLRAPGRVQVRGAGDTYNGTYKVVRVTHNISPSEYTQDFELGREGPGSNIQKVSAP
jgi:hypothetical protein